MFGDFDSDVFDIDSGIPYFSLPLFLIFMIIVPLILLNALIAFMGDSYGSAQENARAAFLLSRADLIVEYETIGFHHIYPFFNKMVDCIDNLQNFSIDSYPEEKLFHNQYCGLMCYFCCLIPLWIWLLQKLKWLILPFSIKNYEGEIMVFISEQDGIPDPTTIPGDHEKQEGIKRMIELESGLESHMSRLDEEMGGFKEDITEMKMMMRKLIQSQFPEEFDNKRPSILATKFDHPDIKKKNKGKKKRNLKTIVQEDIMNKSSLIVEDTIEDEKEQDSKLSEEEEEDNNQKKLGYQKQNEFQF